MEKNLMIAKVCNAANCAYALANGEGEQPSWGQLSENERAGRVAGVNYVLANPEATPESQHNLWMESKTKDGWVYGKKKDNVKKTHPCLVPYDQLPENQRVKDKIFQAIVKALA